MEHESSPQYDPSQNMPSVENTAQQPEIVVVERQEITVGVRPWVGAISLAKENGSISVESIISHDQDVAESEKWNISSDQAEAIVEQLQIKGIVSKTADKHGRYERLEQIADTDQQNKVSSFIGKLTLPKTRRQAIRQAKELVRYNDVVHMSKMHVVDRVAHKKIAASDAAEKVKQRKTSVAEYQNDRQWQQSLRWRLRIDPGSGVEQSPGIVTGVDGNPVYPGRIVAEQHRRQQEAIQQEREARAARNDSREQTRRGPSSSSPTPRPPQRRQLSPEEQIAQRIAQESRDSGESLDVVEPRVRAEYEAEQRRAAQAVADNAARTAIES